MRELKLNIFGLQVIGHCEDQVYDHLSKDFEYFLDESSNNTVPFLELNIQLKNPPYEKIAGLLCLKQSANSMTYERSPFLYNDYYGEALTEVDLEKNKGSIFSSDLNRLCEITYLLILSRTGKKMDVMGMHKIHAFGVKRNNTSFICMMPSKGGKTTLFLDLIKGNKELEIISDDTPIVDTKGNVHSFPLRVGIEGDSSFPEEFNKDIYYLDRKIWGKKKLVPVFSLGRKFAQRADKVILLTGVRKYDNLCTIIERTNFQGFKDLQRHMTVGIGLPMILEYFLELNIKDFIRLTYIFFSRLYSSIILISKSRHFTIVLGTDKKENARILSQFINEQS